MQIVDPELKGRVFDGAIAARCNLCGSSQHWTSQHGSKKARRERAPKDLRDPKPTSDKTVCGHYNGFHPSGSRLPDGRGCTKGDDCDRKHVCSRCGGAHPATSCPKGKKE